MTLVSALGDDSVLERWKERSLRLMDEMPSPTVRRIWGGKFKHSCKQEEKPWAKLIKQENGIWDREERSLHPMRICLACPDGFWVLILEVQ